MMGMCHTCAYMFKISVLICSLKEFILDSFSLWYTFMLKPIALYMLVTSWSSWIILSALLEIKISTVRKVI